MQHRNDLIQDPGCRRTGFGLCRFIIAVKCWFGEFNIPIAERTPGEVIQRICRIVKTIDLNRDRSCFRGFGGFADDPFVEC